MTPSETIAKIRELLNGIKDDASQRAFYPDVPSRLAEALSLLDGLERKGVVITEADKTKKFANDTAQPYQCGACGYSLLYNDFKHCPMCASPLTWKLEATNG